MARIGTSEGMWLATSIGSRSMRPAPSLCRQPLEERNRPIASATVAALLLGGALGFPFWFALMVDALPESIGATLKSLIPGELLPELWPAVLIVGGASWGLALTRIHRQRRPALSTLVGAVCLFLFNVAVLQEPLLGLTPSFAGQAAIAAGVTAALAGGGLGWAWIGSGAILPVGFTAGLAAGVPSLLAVLALEALGVRVGSGEMAMPRLATATSFVSAMSGSLAISVVTERLRRRAMAVHPCRPGLL